MKEGGREEGERERARALGVRLRRCCPMVKQARVAELEALLDQETASREYWERAHASLERRCAALERDADKMRKMCNQV